MKVYNTILSQNSRLLVQIDLLWQLLYFNRNFLSTFFVKLFSVVCSLLEYLFFSGTMIGPKAYLARLGRYLFGTAVNNQSVYRREVPKDLIVLDSEEGKGG